MLQNISMMPYYLCKSEKETFFREEIRHEKYNKLNKSKKVEVSGKVRKE